MTTGDVDYVSWTFTLTVVIGGTVLIILAAFVGAFIRFGDREMPTPPRDDCNGEASTYQPHCRYLVATRTGQLATCEKPARRRDDGRLLCDEHAGSHIDGGAA